MDQPVITDQEFALFQRLIYKIAGIDLASSKKVLLVGRLQRRLREHQFDSFSQYYRLVSSGQNPKELQTMVDLLTTNETYFFREPRHFDYLRDEILANRSRNTPFRIWSAASSSGEEAYTMAMVLAEAMPGGRWEVFGSDISTQVLAKARAGQYSMDRTQGIPSNLMRKHCLKGVRANEGTFLVSQDLRDRVSFGQVNLTQPITADIGMFNVIFLRNVMIYFDTETKRKVVGNLLPRLQPEGYFIVGHSESLNGITNQLVSVQPTIYRKP
ncbi:MAG TPA: protein-glutamate O-methyltransferase CheR [Accumulibacter sp.]|jgi:chemotaxis protein methyltransferase CheR|nr:protein-glutamate O-methyltransferase CheR [Accumulibacter sp.]HQC79653.1 protein-glutamate O-methyltransferase CheR [Accumulibacter sp.]